MFVRRIVLCWFLIGAFGLGAIACQPADSERRASEASTAEQPSADSEPQAVGAPASPESSATPTMATSSTIDIVTTDYAFTAPPRIPSGWVTLRLRNEAEQPHFVVLYRLPEGKDFADYNRGVVRPFTGLYKRYRSGELDQATFFDELTAALPEWFPPASGGGVPLTSPGATVQTTVHLEPGDYVMECYVRAPDPDGDTFHNELGMLRPLIVTEASSGASAPDADVHMSLSNYEIAVDGELTAGEHTVAVETLEAPEGLVGHDVNLVRVTDDSDVEQIAAWMSWVDALQPPAPAELLGGVEWLDPGKTAYFTFTLEPGRYAWISEGYGAQGMVKEFTVQ